MFQQHFFNITLITTSVYIFTCWPLPSRNRYNLPDLPLLRSSYCCILIVFYLKLSVNWFVDKVTQWYFTLRGHIVSGPCFVQRIRWILKHKSTNQIPSYLIGFGNKSHAHFIRIVWKERGASDEPGTGRCRLVPSSCFFFFSPTKCKSTVAQTIRISPPFEDKIFMFSQPIRCVQFCWMISLRRLIGTGKIHCCVAFKTE